MRKTITALLLSALLLCVPLTGRCQEIDLSPAPSPAPESAVRRSGKSAQNRSGQWQASDARLSPRNYILVNRKDFVPSQEILFELASASSHFNNPSTPALALFRVDGPAHVRATPNGKKITQLANDTYVWAYPSDEKDWWVVLLDEQTTGFMHRQNLRPFGK